MKNSDKKPNAEQKQALNKTRVSRRLTEVERAKAVAIGTVILGIVAKNMGYANQTLVCQAGREVFQFVSSLTYKQFRDIKKLANGG